MEPTQTRADVESELLGQPMAGLPVHLESLSGPALQGMSGHQQLVEPFPQGMLGDERRDLLDHRLRLSAGQARRVQPLPRGQPQSVESLRLDAEPGAGLPVEGSSPPQSAGLTQQLLRAARVRIGRHGGFIDQVLEPLHIRGARRHLQHIAAAHRLQHVGAPECAAQPVHMGLEAVGRPGAGVVSPHRVEESVRGDRASAGRHQHGQQQPLEAGEDHRTPILVADPDRAQDVQLHRQGRSPWVRCRAAPGAFSPGEPCHTMNGTWTSPEHQRSS